MLALFIVVALAATTAAQLVAEQQAFFTQICANTNIRFFLLPSRWCQAGVSPCDYTGVTCDAATRSTVERLVIDFDSVTALDGELPSLQNAFNSLVELRIGCGNGHVEGRISPQFFVNNADTLRVFAIHDCPLVRGSLPQTSGLPQALNFTVRATSFGGPLTDAFLADSPMLVHLTLSMSSFNGTLPDAGFGETNSLRVLDLSHNRINGTVPESVCFLPRLERLDLSHNYLRLELPVCFLDSADVIAPTVECDLRDNFYCDTFPDPSLYSPCNVTDKPLQRPSPDPCGVCGGDGSTCVGCDGVPNSGLVDDACGVCDGDIDDPLLCPDCFGVVGGSAVRDLCGVCGGDNSTCIDCAGVLGGSACYDACDVCNGDNSACTDCRGILFGTTRRDVCGVCGGDNSTCIDCNGVPGGGADYDRCGVCDGDNDCVDCAGTVDGTLEYDVCDVCGGDGSGCGVGLIEDGLDDRGIAMTYLWTVVWLLAAAIVMCLCPLLIYVAFVMPRSRRARR